jgi:tetratricopeptide (TPR) repeat protein
MRLLLSILVLVAGLLPPGFAAADQTDPRLDNLFSILRTSDQGLEVCAAENLIWSTWIHHYDAESSRLMQMGIKAMGDGRLQDAAEIFTALVDRAPTYAEAWNKRATVYFLLGKLALAASDVDRTLSLEPRHFGALSGLGQIEMLRGNGDAALSAFQCAIEVHPRLQGMRALINELKQRVRGTDL